MSCQWILLRGLAREKHHSDLFIQKLQKADPESEVIALDLPGAGEYYRLSSPISMTSIAEFIHSHLPKDRSKKRHIVAISLGGMVAMELVRIHPSSVDTVTLINSSFKNLNSFLERLQPEALWHILRAAIATTPESREEEVLKMVSNSSERLQMVPRWSEIAQLRPVSPINFLKQLVVAATYDLPSQKPEVPIFLLTSEGDRMVSNQCSKKLADHWQLPIAIHPTAGHELYIDDPEWVIEKLFLFCGRS
ncbi:alpha/beta hydrolase [bacterium]|nr:alpha/beta hydrolase [bacterium]